MGKIEPVIHITTACNHRCIFCSRKYNPPDPPEAPDEVNMILEEFKDTITIEGGEPTLSKELPILSARAKKAGIREVMLVTNGYSLDEPENIKKLLSAGIDIFNFNFPSHIEKLYNTLSGSKNYHKTVSAIKNCIKNAGPQKTRLTMVLNSLNYKYLKGYAHFIKREFGQIFYAEINMIKLLGSVRKRIWLIPRLKDIAQYLKEGFSEFDKLGINFISDGIPLCFMNGFEHKNIDAYMSIKGGCFSTSEKSHFKPCLSCKIKSVCPGPRKDYVSIFGFNELKPVSNPRAKELILKRIKSESK